MWVSQVPRKIQAFRWAFPLEKTSTVKVYHSVYKSAHTMYKCVHTEPHTKP